MKVDDRTEVTPGFKFNDWEMRGVPVRIEIGPKDVEKGSVAIARRDIPGREGKQFISQEGLAAYVENLLKEIHSNMLAKATAFRDANIHDPADYEELKQVVRRRLGALVLVRQRRVRSQGEGRYSRHHPLHSARPGTFRRQVHRLRREGQPQVYFAKAY